MIDLSSIFGTKKGKYLIVVPPFAGIERPSLGAHQLQACALEAGIRVDVFYANLCFASMIGLQTYDQIVNSPYSYHIGERLFSTTAYGNEGISYLIREYDTLHQNEDPISKIENFKKVLLEMKSVEVKIPGYVKQIADIILEAEYEMVGFTTTFQQVSSSISIAIEVKLANPDMLILMGGGNCEAQMGKEMLNLSSAIDYVFSGESEFSFIEFLKNAEDGVFPSSQFIQGKPSDNLNSLPLVDYQSYYDQMKKLPLKDLWNSISLMYETSRGCWWGQKHHCTFCGLGGVMAFREKAPDKVIHELRTLLDAHPNSNVFMVDNIIPHSYYKTLLPRLEIELPGVKIFYELKSNLTFEKCVQLQRAGVTLAQPGIEALSSSLLKRMKKGVSAYQNVNLLRYARSLNILLSWNLLYGFPGDTVEEYHETLELIPFLRHLIPPAGPFRLSLDRFSPYYDFPERYEINSLRPNQGYQGIYPPGTNMDNLAYHFIGDFVSASLDNPNLISDIQKEVDYWSRQWDRPEKGLPQLHIKQMTENKYLLVDTRKLADTKELHFIDRAQVVCLLSDFVSERDPYADWALSNKLVVEIDHKLIPLATASPDLMMKFRVDSETMEVVSNY